MSRNLSRGKGKKGTRKREVGMARTDAYWRLLTPTDITLEWREV